MLIMEDKNIKKMRKEEAVSSVISIILLVVIVVILAAVVALFAFGVGGPVKIPVTKLDFVTTTDGNFTPAPGNLCITNSGGDPLVLSELTMKVKKAGNNGVIILGEQKMIQWVNGTTKYLTPGITLCGQIADVTLGDILLYQVTDIRTGQLVSDTSTTVNFGKWLPGTWTTGGTNKQIFFNVSNIPINVYNNIQFTAYIGSTPITPDSWSSSNHSVGTIDNTGFFRALSNGVTTITVRLGNASGNTTVTVG
jgi:FlaG/FlaF family flagellin (archaellin)